MGNGAVVQAHGKGTIEVQTKGGSRTIKDVLHVPDLEQNLLSVGQLVEHGYGLHFGDCGCIILDKGHKRPVIEDSRQVVTKVNMEKKREKKQFKL